MVLKDSFIKENAWWQIAAYACDKKLAKEMVQVDIDQGIYRQDELKKVSSFIKEVAIDLVKRKLLSFARKNEDCPQDIKQDSEKYASDIKNIDKHLVRIYKTWGEIRAFEIDNLVIKE